MAGSDPDAPISLRKAALIVRMNRENLRAVAEKGEIPYIRRGKRMFFLRKHLVEWLDMTAREPKIKAPSKRGKKTDPGFELDEGLMALI